MACKSARLFDATLSGKLNYIRLQQKKMSHQILHKLCYYSQKSHLLEYNEIKARQYVLSVDRFAYNERCQG